MWPSCHREDLYNLCNLAVKESINSLVGRVDKNSVLGKIVRVPNDPNITLKHQRSKVPSKY